MPRPPHVYAEGRSTRHKRPQYRGLEFVEDFVGDRVDLAAVGFDREVGDLEIVLRPWVSDPLSEIRRL